MVLILGVVVTLIVGVLVMIIIFQKFGLLIPAVRVALMASGIVYLELLPVVLGFFALVAFVTS